jgi:hypothetical protein
MSLHAIFEQVDDVPIVWILCETQIPAVIHKLFKFFRLIFAELLDCDLFFLFLDVGILLSL